MSKKMYKAVMEKRYQCLKCKKSYDNVEAAEKCSKPVLPPEARHGDIVVNRSGFAFRLDEVSHDNGRIGLNRVDESLWLHGKNARDSHVSRYYSMRRESCGYTNRYEMLTKEMVEKEIASVKRQLRAGVKLLAMLENHCKGPVKK